MLAYLCFDGVGLQLREGREVLNELVRDLGPDGARRGLLLRRSLKRQDQTGSASELS